MEKIIIEDGDYCKGCKLVDKYNKLIEENKEQEEYIKYWQEKCDIKQERIDEVIEYIEHERFKRKILLGISEKKYTVNILNEVVKILKGDSNEI